MANLEKLNKEFDDLISRLTEDDWRKWHEGLNDRIERQKQEMLAKARHKTFGDQLLAGFATTVDARFKTGAGLRLHAEGIQKNAFHAEPYTFHIILSHYTISAKSFSVRALEKLSNLYLDRPEKMNINSNVMNLGINESQLIAY